MENDVWLLLKELAGKVGITEVIINNVDNVYIERNGELIRLNVKLRPDHIKKFCIDIAKFNKISFDLNHPILDGSLPDGSRINIISSAYTQSSPAITIRKYTNSMASFDTIDPNMFGMNTKWILLFKAMVQAKMNVLVSGGTGAGKTTFLNILLQEIPKIERIVTIEDTKELKFNIPNNVRLVSNSNLQGVEKPLKQRDLLKNTLRMRPDRIIIGEVRGEEAFDLLQAMNTGHDGSMCTIHANSAAESLSRLETLFLYSGYDVPLKAIRKQISVAVDFVVQLGRDRDGRRIIKGVTEVQNLEQDVILLQDIGTFADQELKFTGLVPKRLQKLMDFGLDSEFFMDI